MVIEFSLGLTTFELQQFVYACVLKANILALVPAGLRVKDCCHMGMAVMF